MKFDVNIITNALEAAEKGDNKQRWVKINAAEAGENLLLKISDSGNGMKQEIQDKISFLRE